MPHVRLRLRPIPPCLAQAAREIAGTIASSANRVFLNADSLMLNLGDVAASLAKKA